MMGLHDYIAAASTRQFRYGRHDCVTFAGRWAERQTGRALVPAYSSLREGRACLEGRSLLDLLRREFPEVPRLRAAAGDIAVLHAEHDLPALGIVCGETVAAFVGRRIGHVPLSDALHVFRVRP